MVRLWENDCRSVRTKSHLVLSSVICQATDIYLVPPPVPLIKTVIEFSLNDPQAKDLADVLKLVMHETFV